MNGEKSVRQQLGLNNSLKVYTRNSAQKDSKPRKKKEGHDELIQILAGKDFNVQLQTTGGYMQGKLIESDRFTITVVLDDAEQSKVLIYKHAIVYMKFVKPAVAE